MKNGVNRITIWIASFILIFCGCMSPGEDRPQKEKNELGKVLIIYYSWSGKTHEIAEMIQEKTGADMCRLETVKTYLPLPEIYQEAKEEVANGYLPELKTTIPDLGSYDLIIIGSPIWWYSIAPAVLTLLSQQDFNGKTVTLFTTHEGELGDYYDSFSHSIQNAKILRGENFHNNLFKTPEALDNKILAWLDFLAKCKQANL